LLVFGAISFTFFAFHVVKFLYVHFLRAKSDLKKYGATKGYWAAVTGASDGIGKEYALQLAKAGFNIMLISRTESKLKDVEKEIHASSSNVQTKVIVLDLAHAGDADWQRMKSEFAAVKLGVLVNNAGVSTEMPEVFGETDLQRLREIVNVNITAVNELTYVALPTLLKNKEANLRGLVLSVGSGSGLSPTPMLSVYAGTKAYLSNWSSGLHREYTGAGVDFDCVVAFFTVSNMSKIKKPSMFVPMPAKLVRSSLRQVGTGDLSFAPYFYHGLLEFFVQSLPTVVLPWTVDKSHQICIGVRKAAIAKAARESGKPSKAK